MSARRILPPLTSAQQRLVEENIGLAGFAVAHLSPAIRLFYANNPSFDADDMYETALLGLCMAAQRFDPERGIKFSTFAILYIKQQCIEVMRRVSSYHKATGTYTPTPYSLSYIIGHDGDGEPFGLEDRIADPDAPVEDQVCDLDQAQIVRDALMALPYRERVVLARQLADTPPTQAQLSQQFNVSTSRVSQLEKRAKQSLRALLTPLRKEGAV